MKMFNEMSLKSIRNQLVKVGVEMTDEQFNSLTHSELKAIYRKSKRAYKLYSQVDAIINKTKAPTPAIPMPTTAEKVEMKNKNAKGLDKSSKA